LGRYALLEKNRPELAALHPHHRAMARALVTGKLRPGELAALFGMSPAQTSVIINSALFKAEVARQEALLDVQALNVRMELEALQPRALEVLSEDLYRRPGSFAEYKLRNATALKILDKTGYPDNAPVQKHINLDVGLKADLDEMSREDLYRSVMNLIEGDEGTWEAQE